MTIPVQLSRVLVSDKSPMAPEGFSRQDLTLQEGLPRIVNLDPEFSLQFFVPTGIGAHWRELPASTLIASDLPQRLPVDQTDGPDQLGEQETQAVARVRVLLNGERVATLPLTLGLTRPVPEAGSPTSGARLEFVPLSWRVTAGTLHRAGDHGAEISFAWRRADRAVDQYSTPPVNPHLVKRLPPEFRMVSTLGFVQTPVVHRRFALRRRIRL